MVLSPTLANNNPASLGISTLLKAPGCAGVPLIIGKSPTAVASEPVINGGVAELPVLELLAPSEFRLYEPTLLVHSTWPRAGMTAPLGIAQTSVTVLEVTPFPAEAKTP
jgi:hypothetical protein